MNLHLNMQLYRKNTMIFTRSTKRSKAMETKIKTSHHPPNVLYLPAPKNRIQICFSATSANSLPTTNVQVSQRIMSPYLWRSDTVALSVQHALVWYLKPSKRIASPELYGLLQKRSSRTRDGRRSRYPEKRPRKYCQDPPRNTRRIIEYKHSTFQNPRGTQGCEEPTLIPSK